MTEARSEVPLLGLRRSTSDLQNAIVFCGIMAGAMILTVLIAYPLSVGLLTFLCAFFGIATIGLLAILYIMAEDVYESFVRVSGLIDRYAKLLELLEEYQDAEDQIRDCRGHGTKGSTI